MRARVLLGAGILAAATLAAPAPAQAAGMNLTHYSPDDGYDTDITVKCGNGAIQYIWEGGNSNMVCYGGVTDVWAPSGTQVVCYQSGLGWRVTYRAGWHAAGGSNQTCVNQLV